MSPGRRSSASTRAARGARMASSSSITSICCSRPRAASTSPFADFTSCGVPCSSTSSCARSADACASALRSRQRRVVGVDARARAARRTACGSAPRPAWPSPAVACCACRRACASAISARRAVGRVRLATFSSAPSACVSWPCGDQALGGQVALLQRDQRLPGRDRVALADVHLLDAAADARADLDRARLDRAAPLERLAGLPHPVDAVGDEREGDDHQQRDPAFHRRESTPNSGKMSPLGAG